MAHRQSVPTRLTGNTEYAIKQRTRFGRCSINQFSAIIIDTFETPIEKAYLGIIVVKYVEREAQAVLLLSRGILNLTGTHCKVGKLICR